ncbi:hypothetical protein NSK_006045 [Nannochloropsis salina CCMP1776]|uniref:PUM-HD domain-containing protein n=1 Tax=Nannochloropsis salina CCMP1776 TaxID=1027361 RepID=A0A4D9CTP5_9STRA|nr:hypothetical protein NSK_006045 [Nannochloropsis salina CCMP1776]|eukprot:TFJ82621.1 hypothetical protein NSK_006045 [Nannochloropsis salina CCMP1776]
MQQGQQKRSRAGGNDSKLHGDGGGPANKKRHVKYERAKARPAFDLVARAKAIWAIFRSKRLGKDEREKMSEELYSLIKGKLHQIAVKHDAARVVQAALKHGNRIQQEAYITELLEYLLEFSKVQYAHFIVLRLLDVTASLPAERKRVSRVFTGKVHTLATHAVGAKVLEGIFSTYPKQDTQALRAELYGRETTLLLGDPTGPQGRDLAAILRELPGRRERVLSNVLGMIQKMLVKDLAVLPFVQELIWEYTCNAGPVLVRELVPTLLDYLLLLTGTRPGCKALAECAAYGTPKDRKKMLKALKGYVVPTLLHKDAYLLILRLADVIDDTVAFNKAVWQELLERNAVEESMLRLATHVKASKVLLCLLAPEKRGTFLMKDEVELLRPAFIPATEKKEEKEEQEGQEGGEELGEGGGAGAGEGGGVIRPRQGSSLPSSPSSIPTSSVPAPSLVPTSKKDPGLRREELLAPLKAALLELGKQQARTLLLSAEGSFILYEVATRWRDAALLKAIAHAAASEGFQEQQVGSKEGEGDKEEEGDREAVDEVEEGGVMDEGGEDDEEEKADEVCGMGNKQGSGRLEAAREEEAAGPTREHRIAYKTIKRLILFEVGPKPGKKPECPATPVEKLPTPLFSEALYEECTGRWMDWLASMRGGFLVEALVKVPAVGVRVMDELHPKENELRRLASSSLKGASAVLAMMGGQKVGMSPKRGEKSRTAGAQKVAKIAVSTISGKRTR